jgi:hypothetical protein
LSICASDGDVFGKLTQESDSMYHVIKDNDCLVLSLAYWSVPSAQAAQGVPPTSSITATTANGCLVASIVQTHGVCGRTEFHIQPGADVALVIVCALALLTFGEGTPSHPISCG